MFNASVFQEREDHLFQRHCWSKTGKDSLSEADHCTDITVLTQKSILTLSGMLATSHVGLLDT